MRHDPMEAQDGGSDPPLDRCEPQRSKSVDTRRRIVAARRVVGDNCAAALGAAAYS
jgi:hypothetical protein